MGPHMVWVSYTIDCFNILILLVGLSIMKGKVEISFTTSVVFYGGHQRPSIEGSLASRCGGKERRCAWSS